MAMRSLYFDTGKAEPDVERIFRRVRAGLDQKGLWPLEFGVGVGRRPGSVIIDVESSGAAAVREMVGLRLRSLKYQQSKTLKRFPQTKRDI